MMRRELESNLKQLGLRYRFDRVVAPFGLVSALGSVGIMMGLLPAEALYVALLIVLLFLVPVSVRRAAQTVNRRHGDNPDMLCAFENRDNKRPAIRALEERCLAATRAHLGAWRVGKRWLWIGCSMSWCLPMLVKSPRAWHLSSSTVVSESLSVAVNRAGALTSDSDPKPVQNGQLNKEQSASKKAQEPQKIKVAAKGNKAELSGTKVPTIEPAPVTSGQPSRTSAIPGRGTGGSTAPGKLTESAIRGRIEVLKEDHLDPSEKYPVEYHEAIREWFLKRGN